MPPPSFRAAWQQALDRARSKNSIDLPEATALIRAYFAYEAYRRLAPLVTRLAAVEDHRRYTVRDDEIVSASCKERVCQYVYISGVAVSVTQKKIKHTNQNKTTNK